MKIEILEKGITILDDIKNAQSKLSVLRKLYGSYKEKELTEENIEELFAIATSNVEHIIELKQKKLSEL